MCLQDAPVFTSQRNQRNGFGRGKSKIVKYPPIGRRLAICNTRGIEPLRQRLTRGRMLILTKPEKIFGPNLAGQPKPLHARPEPFAGHPLSLVVVVADTKMLLKVFLRVFEIVLCLGRDHTQTLSEPARDFLQTLQVRVPILW